MKVGDLVIRKDAFAEWQEDNPWMKDKEYTGVVVETANPKANGKMQMICVYWFLDGVKWWYGEHKLEVINESR
jgi:hypothetical protein